MAHTALWGDRMKRIGIVLLLGLICMTACYGESPEEREAAVKGYVALTFDDGPSGALTDRLLDGLEAAGARATFFLCGYRMEQYPECLERYVAGGHQLGVHSTVHTDLTKLSREAVHQDMAETGEKIYQATGIRPVVMRPPGGAWNEIVTGEAEAEGMSVILWSVDPQDWASHDASRVLEVTGNKTGCGDVVLMHDMSPSSVDAALGLVRRMQQEGYVFVTVSELAGLTGTKLEPGQVYQRFPAGKD